MSLGTTSETSGQQIAATADGCERNCHICDECRAELAQRIDDALAESRGWPATQEEVEGLAGIYQKAQADFIEAVRVKEISVHRDYYSQRMREAGIRAILAELPKPDIIGAALSVIKKAEETNGRNFLEDFMALRAERDELRKRVEELEADKERLDWWEANIDSIYAERDREKKVSIFDHMEDICLGEGSDLRSAIDSAREKEDRAIQLAEKTGKRVGDHKCACPSEHYENFGPVCPVCNGKR